MKIFLLLSLLTLIRPHVELNSPATLRLYNDSKYLIHRYTITINGSNFSYSNIYPHTLSPYIEIPYIYTSHTFDLTFSKRSLFSHRGLIKIKSFPIDNTGEKKYEDGSLTLILKIVKKEGNYYPVTVIKKE